MTTRVPEPAAGDSTDVLEALDIASALWEKGNRTEAVRFVRRAAEAAEKDGKASRVIGLARAAEELDKYESVSIPPPARSDTRLGAGPTSAPPPAPVASRPPPPPPSRPAPKPSTVPAPRSSAAPPPVPSSRAPKLASAPPPPHAPAHTPSSVRVARNTMPPEEDKRVRVSVRVSARDAGLLVVRPLADGEAPPPGTREAFLVMADEADLDAASNGGAR